MGPRCSFPTVPNPKVAKNRVHLDVQAGGAGRALRHTGNWFAAASGASLRDLVERMGHDSMRAALNYQHRTAAAGHAVADAMSAQIEAFERGDGTSKCELASRESSGDRLTPLLSLTAPGGRDRSLSNNCH